MAFWRAKSDQYFFTSFLVFAASQRLRPRVEFQASGLRTTHDVLLSAYKPIVWIIAGGVWSFLETLAINMFAIAEIAI